MCQMPKMKVWKGKMSCLDLKLWLEHQLTPALLRNKPSQQYLYLT